MAQSIFDKDHWLKVITNPDWYFELRDFLNSSSETLGKESSEFVNLRREVRRFFEEQLLAGKVKLAESGPNLDEQRQTIDTIVIHHTSAEPGYRLSYMNAVHLTNIYAPYFANPTDEREKSLKGKPAWSGHFKGSKQVFYGYHWFMRMDGSFERLLEDKNIGWHAGNWAINKRSIGICLDNDYDKRDPTDEILQKLGSHIKQNYPFIKTENIIGHCEARKGTTCPGKNFKAIWKEKLGEF